MRRLAPVLLPALPALAQSDILIRNARVVGNGQIQEVRPGRILRRQ